MPIIPARLEHTPEGVLYSSAFADAYHSRDDALGQARHVFLAGNGLPGRWQRRERFTIVETGFGAGLNFLATWAAWREDPLRCARLHFVSCERQPFRREDLASIREQGAGPLHGFGDDSLGVFGLLFQSLGRTRRQPVRNRQSTNARQHELSRRSRHCSNLLQWAKQTHADNQRDRHNPVREASIQIQSPFQSNGKLKIYPYYLTLAN